MRMLTKKKLLILAGSLLALCVVMFRIAVLPELLKPRYLVQFDSAGGTAVESQKVKEGKTVLEVENPEKYGFAFLGWQLDGTAYDFSREVTSDLVLKAAWESDGTTTICSVYFFSDGGTEIESIEVSEGYTATPPIDPVREGYTFAGWFLGENEKFDFSTPITESLMLFAKWEQVTTSASAVPSASPSAGTTSDSASAATNKPTAGGNTTNHGSTNNGGTTVTYEDEITWDNIQGTWYLTGTDDVKFTVTMSSSEGITYKYINFDDRTGVHYSCDLGGSLSLVCGASIFLEYLDMTLINKALVIHTSQAGDFTFYRQKNYPAHVESTIEKLYNSLQGKWYVEGFGDDAYVVYTIGTKDGEKGLYVNQTNTIVVGQSSYFIGYYSLDDYKSRYGITCSDDILKVIDCSTTVTLSKAVMPVYVSSIWLDSNYNIESSPGAIIVTSLRALVYPLNADDTSVLWSSSNSGIVEITNIIYEASSGAYNVQLMIKGTGTAVITATSNDGAVTVTCQVTAAEASPVAVDGVTLSQSSAAMYTGNTLTIRATISPQGAPNRSVTWSSSDTNVATVSSSGLVKAVGTGSAVITVKTVDGGYTATCTVTVSNPALTVNGGIAFTTYYTGGSAVSGMLATAYPSGGTGTYTYYYIKLYYNGTLIGETTDTSSNQLFVSKADGGTYTVEVTVRDSAGNTASSTSSLTIS